MSTHKPELSIGDYVYAEESNICGFIRRFTDDGFEVQSLDSRRIKDVEWKEPKEQISLAKVIYLLETNEELV